MLPLVRARAQAMGMQWANALKPHQLSPTQAFIVEGRRQSGARAPATGEKSSDASASDSYDLIARKPPKEVPIVSGEQDLTLLNGRFGIAYKKLLHSVNPDYGADFDAHVPELALYLHIEGLYFGSSTKLNSGAECIAAIPVLAIIDTVARIQKGGLTLKTLSVDHIVHSYVPPDGLEGWRVSRWRGDAFFRLQTDVVRLEVSVVGA